MYLWCFVSTRFDDSDYRTVSSRETIFISSTMLVRRTAMATYSLSGEVGVLDFVLGVLPAKVMC